MYIKIEIPPAARCRLCSNRTRPDNSAFYLAGDPGGCMKVAVCLDPQDPQPPGLLTLYGAIVNMNGENHPYSFHGPNCNDGVLLCNFAMPPDEREVRICLEHITVVSCSPNRWPEVMAAKKKVINRLRDPASRLTAQNVKNFRISFFMDGAKEAVTRDIQVTSQQASGGANASAAVPEVTVLDTLPRELCINGANQKLAILLSDSVPENAIVKSVTCTAVECYPGVQFSCRVCKHIKALVIVELVVDNNTRKLLPYSSPFRCQLTVAMEAGGIAQPAICGLILLHNACPHRHSWAGDSALDSDAGQILYHVPDYAATDSTHRREQPSGSWDPLPLQHPMLFPLQQQPLQHPMQFPLQQQQQQLPHLDIDAAILVASAHQTALSGQVEFDAASFSHLGLYNPLDPILDPQQHAEMHQLPMVEDRHQRREREFDEDAFFTQPQADNFGFQVEGNYRLEDVLEVIELDQAAKPQ